MAEPHQSTTDLFEIIPSTRSMRRLKPDAVPNELIGRILEASVSAPSGGNMQRWRFLVIRDAVFKKTVGAYYKRVGPRYRAGEPAPGTSRERFLRLLDAAEYLAAHIHGVDQGFPGVTSLVDTILQPDEIINVIAGLLAGGLREAVEQRFPD